MSVVVRNRQLPRGRPAPRRLRGRRRASRPGLGAWWFLVPAIVLYAFIVLVPSARGAWLGFTSWDGLSAVKHFVGLANFREILHDPASRGAVGHTLLIAISVTVIQNGVGLFLALGVNSRIKSRNVLRVFLFAPAVMTPVIVGYLWKFILAPHGVLNSILVKAGGESWAQNWLGSPSLVLWAVVGVIVWQFSGYSMAIFLAGLQSVPPELIEAATVDGAGPVQRFWYIVRPMLAPAITINLMLSIIGGLKLFDQVYILTGGGPGHASETLSTLIYKNAFQFNEFGYGVALALVLAIFVAFISGAQYRLLRRQERVVG